MSGLTPRGILRWKEWIPLVTQQLRLRNVIQVIAFNIQVSEDIIARTKRKKLTYYYTLHLTSMSSPFYTSEQLESENPKWSEMDLQCDHIGAVNGVVIRVWAHIPDEEEDIVITVWGVYFSGLVFIGSQLGCAEPSSFSANTLVFHLHGGYFTASHCLINPHPVTPRTLSIQLSALQVKPSYQVNLLLQLQSLKHEIKKESQATSLLREQILDVMQTGLSESSNLMRGSATLRKLLSKQAPPKADPQEVHSVKKQIEMARFRVKLLQEQRDIAQVTVQKKLTEKNKLLEKNQDRESELMENFCCLRRDAEKKRELKIELNNCKSQLVQTSALLDIRRRELISQLSYIYPIIELPDGRFTIRDVHLPNSEDFEGKDEIMISVALGFVAHLIQMISYFLDVPTRYPICHFGSRSKIIDHITDNIPDKEREFPLYSRGKERHSFNYGVYLLNKNIAQLRWYCGLTTSDLRHTLPNLKALMELNKKDDIKKCIEIRRQEKRRGLSFSLDAGLNSVALAGGYSDPQDYTGRRERRRRAETEQSERGRGPQIHDLASLMSLDIPSHTQALFVTTTSPQSEPTTQDGPASDLSPGGYSTDGGGLLMIAVSPDQPSTVPKHQFKSNNHNHDNGIKKENTFQDNSNRSPVSDCEFLSFESEETPNENTIGCDNLVEPLKGEDALLVSQDVLDNVSADTSQTFPPRPSVQSCEYISFESENTPDDSVTCCDNLSDRRLEPVLIEHSKNKSYCTEKNT